MTQYNGLAIIYDQLMQGIDYDEWAGYMEEIIKRHGGVPETSMLDLASGTGSTTLAMARLGYRAIGLDLSEEMLTLARKKTKDVQVSYLQADMRTFTLPAPVGLAVSFQDGINYLLTQEDLIMTMHAVYRALCKGGLFIFDINRVEKLKTSRAEVAWADCDEFTLIWETQFLQEDVWEIRVTGFSADKEGSYRKFSEVHQERVIPEREVLTALESAGFTLLGTYAAFTHNPPDESTRRVFYVARKEAAGNACGPGGTGNSPQHR